MLTSEHAHFTIQWADKDGNPARVDPNTPLRFEFNPPEAGTISALETHADGRTATSTTTTGFVEAGSPTTSASVDCVGDADFGAGIEEIRLRATFSVESPEAQAVAGTFALDAATPKA